jgi:hypothetical protein
MVEGGLRTHYHPLHREYRSEGMMGGGEGGKTSGEGKHFSFRATSRMGLLITSTEEGDMNK